jgi:hypothetical protein
MPVIGLVHLRLDLPKLDHIVEGDIEPQARPSHFVLSVIRIKISQALPSGEAQLPTRSPSIDSRIQTLGESF